MPGGLHAQAPSVYYVYDELNRLIAVVDQHGDAATYTYDAVSNILRIDRFDAAGLAGGAAISLFTPSAGAAGSTVQVFGRGFGVTIAQNSLFFNGRLTTITAAAPNRLVAIVPAGATTGPITVTAPAGSATSSRVFRVLGDIAIAPETATVRVTGHATFVVTDAGVPITNVRLAVNGLPGGDPALGTISADGVYMAPPVIPVPPVVTVTATHQDDASLSASAAVTVLPPLNVFISARPASIAAVTPPLTLDRSIGAAVSVAAASPDAVMLGVSTPVSVEIEPVVLGVSPSSVAPGATTLTLTLTGRGLIGATSLVFLRDSSVDSTVTAVNLTVDADGTHATADIAIARAAPPGARVVQITTPLRTSSPAGTGGNVFMLQ
ncbi:MAG TPA: IPT/TIG domain-containing protein [Mycobacteriales bacterium]|nr:IPT/TIG domain-containing protein [Mycobacteriales bacterium]